VSNDSRIDLNLFRVLDAIYVQGGITAAARALHLTQPAITHALNRLREHFGDPLFVRQGNRVLPTERTLAVIDEVQRHLRGLQGAVRAEGSVHPEMLDMEITVGARDLLESAALPALATALADEAPGLRLASRRVPLDAVERALASGQLDLVFERRLRVGPRVVGAYLFDETLVAVMRRGHPLANGELGRADYFDAGHVSVSPLGEPSTLDVLLANDGRYRKIQLVSQHHFAACEIVAAGDLLLTLPRFYAQKMAALLPIVVKPLPLKIKPYPIFAYWHEVREADRIHQWFRHRAIAIIQEAASRATGQE